MGKIRGFFEDWKLLCPKKYRNIYHVLCIFRNNGSVLKYSRILAIWLRGYTLIQLPPPSHISDDLIFRFITFSGVQPRLWQLHPQHPPPYLQNCQKIWKNWSLGCIPCPSLIAVKRYQKSPRLIIPIFAIKNAKNCKDYYICSPWSYFIYH